MSTKYKFHDQEDIYFISTFNEAIMNLLIWNIDDKEKEESWQFVKNKLKGKNFLQSVNSTFDLFLQLEDAGQT